jgi:cytochrome P450 family 142 subfamily A polypeptide 1
MATSTEAIPPAVEEIIRWVTPHNNMFRTATRDAEIGGTPVHAGDRVMLAYPSANRDELVFDDPYTFDITRSPNPHVAFGFGTHFCLGASLARLELRTLFTHLTRRITNLRVLEEPDIEPNIFVGAVRSFRLGFDRR